MIKKKRWNEMEEKERMDEGKMTREKKIVNADEGLTKWMGGSGWVEEKIIQIGQLEK